MPPKNRVSYTDKNTKVSPRQMGSGEGELKSKISDSELYSTDPNYTVCTEVLA